MQLNENIYGMFIVYIGIVYLIEACFISKQLLLIDFIFMLNMFTRYSKFKKFQTVGSKSSDWKIFFLKEIQIYRI